MRVFLVLIAFFTTTFVVGQQGNQGADALKYCDVHGAHERLLQDNPGIEEQIEQSERDLERFTQEFIEAGNANNRVDYTLPVVFHIIHANGLENISDEQIYDAMRILNEDFNLGNVDIASVIPEFQGITADVGVEFKLARIDPDGNCTKGIVRVYSTQTASGGENLKSISPIWDRSSYVNIWVAAELSGGAAGYTMTPGSVDGFWGAQVDGIVIKNTYVGSIGTGSYTRSRALTHEIGHWINLRHTWGGTNDPDLDENCNSDDNVSDTPNTRGWTSCNPNGESCGSLDNVQNFMEYSYCSRMFTNGQKSRMLAALNSPTASRNQLWTNSNLQDTGVLGDGELCEVEFESSIREICVGDSVIFNDNSFHEITSRDWTFDGGTPAVSQEEEVVVYYNEPGLFSVGLEVGDGSQTLNETVSQYIRVWPIDGQNLPYQEGFEAGGDVLTNWSLSNPDNDVAWEITDQVGLSGNHSLKLGNRYNPAGQVDEVMSTTINLADTNLYVSMSFKYAYARRNPGNSEKLTLWVSNDCGVSWGIKALLSNDFETAPYTSGNWSPNSTQWQEVTINNITASQYVSNFRYKFVFESDGGNNVYIDDINIDGTLISNAENIIRTEDVSLFPNPANGNAQLQIQSGLPFSYNLAIYNSVGQQVQNLQNQYFPGGISQTNINTSDLSIGVYVVDIQTASGNRIVKRLVVSR